MKKFTYSCLITVALFFAGEARIAAQGPLPEGMSATHAAIAGAPYRFLSIQPLEVEEGRAMVKNYKSKDPRKDAGGFASLDPQDMTFLANQTGVTRIFMVQAAYLTTAPDAKKRGRPVTLIVVERNMGARQFDYYESLNLCPPPEGTCDLEKIAQHP
jgi:hypothetical protein